jgi:Zn-dependent protease
LRERAARRSLAGSMDPQFLVLGVIWYIVFLFSTTCHEGAHALVAKIGGDTTAFEGGQVTLNPLPHIQREPMGMVVVPIISYLLPPHWLLGWASAPYDPVWRSRHPRRAALMALAGPAANFLLMILAGVAIRVGIAMKYFIVPESANLANVTVAAGEGGARLAATFLSVLFALNLLLGTFNLLPVPPLDGNTGITLFMSEDRARRFMDWTTRSALGFAGILLAWFIYGRLFDYIFRAALVVLYQDPSWM